MRTIALVAFFALVAIAMADSDQAPAGAEQQPIKGDLQAAPAWGLGYGLYGGYGLGLGYGLGIGKAYGLHYGLGLGKLYGGLFYG